jgi:hypothetical protein
VRKLADRRFQQLSELAARSLPFWVRLARSQIFHPVDTLPEVITILIHRVLCRTRANPSFTAIFVNHVENLAVLAN